MAVKELAFPVFEYHVFQYQIGVFIRAPWAGLLTFSASAEKRWKGPVWVGENRHSLSHSQQCPRSLWPCSLLAFKGSSCCWLVAFRTSLEPNWGKKKNPATLPGLTLGWIESVHYETLATTKNGEKYKHIWMFHVFLTVWFYSYREDEIMT